MTMLPEIEKRARILQQSLERLSDELDAMRCDDEKAVQFALMLRDFATKCARFSLYTQHEIFSFTDDPKILKAYFRKVMREYAREMTDESLRDEPEPARLLQCSSIIRECEMMLCMLDALGVDKFTFRERMLEQSKTIAARYNTRGILENLKTD